MILRNCFTIRSLCSQLLCRIGQGKVGGESMAMELWSITRLDQYIANITMHIMFDSRRLSASLLDFDEKQDVE